MKSQKRQKYYYKIVYTYQSAENIYQYVPAIASITMRYNLNEYVKAPFGGLFVFATLENAIAFCKEKCFGTKGHVIHKCNARKPVELRGNGYYLDGSLKDAWKPTAEKYAWWPQGTRAFKEVKLLEKVY